MRTEFLRGFVRFCSRRLVHQPVAFYAIITDVSIDPAIGTYYLLTYSTRKTGRLVGGQSTVAFALSSLSLLIADRIPRQGFMALGFVGCLAVLSIQAGINGSILANPELWTDDTVHASVIIVAALPWVFDVFEAMFLQTSQLFYIAEIFPTHLRAKGMALAMLIYNLLPLLRDIAAYYAIYAINWKFYIVFIGLNVIACYLLTKLPVSRCEDQG